MSQPKLTPMPDSAEQDAKDAYSIYRGMQRGEPTIPHWDDLDRVQRGLLEWTVRFALLRHTP